MTAGTDSGGQPVDDLNRLRRRVAELTAQNERLLKEISEHTGARAAFRETEERFRAVFQSAPDLIFTKDRERRYTMVNPAMERLHCLPASEMIGKRAEELMSRSAAKRIREVDLRVLDGETVEEEYMNTIRGVSMNFHGIRVPLWKPNGEVSGICGIVRNTTERWKAHGSFGERVEIDYPSNSMREALTLARRATAADGNVLLLGESGCGKDHLARWIHEHSGRSRGPYFAINCAAVAKDLADSELFGHERGAFTGARDAKKGLLQLAEGGTLLLNEIGELSIPLQAKLLTFLDTRSFLRVGGQEHIHVDARIIAATHRNLQEEVQEGNFLTALFYRLNVFTIVVPPLRERPEDIPLLAREIISRLTGEMQLSEPPPLDSGAWSVLKQYDWPGNVRELRNVLERSLMLWDGGILKLSVPMPESSESRWSHRVYFPTGRSLHILTDEFRYAICLEALRRSNGSKHDAARLLNISRGALYRYLKRGQLPRENDTPN
ncbi:MAG: sigma 54-interacting transcriptional regulator [Pseudomonadota bacterium]